MKVMFYKAKYGNWMDWIINVYTGGGGYSHCEFLLNNGDIIGASQYEGKVRVKNGYTKEKWTVVEMPESFNPAGKACAVEKVDKKYDWLGIFGFAFLRKLNFIDDKDKYFCSELVAECLGYYKPESFSPNRLYRTLIIDGGIVK